MDKRVLMVATVPSMIGQFNMNNIHILMELGYEVDVAADFTDVSVWPPEKIQMFKTQLKDMGINIIQLDFSRNLLKLGRHIESYKQTVRLIKRRRYLFIHTHTPIASAIVRQAAHLTNTRVIYTAHGFHFFDGAPLKNWLIFYPIEKHFSRYTDILITINKEDYKRASEHFKAKKTLYVPGVGVDTEKFAPRACGRERIRKELDLDDKQILLLSVGELNTQKNHESVIRALKGIDNITYAIVGKGELRNQLMNVAKEFGVDLRIQDYKNDIADYYDAADIYILPSIREGLDVSLMEAMASSLPCLVSNIHGNFGLIDSNSGFLFDPKSLDEIKIALKRAVSLNEEDKKELGTNYFNKIKSFNLQSVNDIALKIYRGGYEHLAEILRRQQKRTEIGVPYNCKLLISVGELSVRKNHSVVVKALQYLPDDYWYIVVGKGVMERQLLSLDKTGRLKLLGFRNDIVDLLYASDIFIFPSIQEGLPVALMEAMAASMMCLVSRIRGNIDLIHSDEYYLQGNAINMSKRIKEMSAYCYSDDVGENNRMRIEEEFSTMHIGKKMKEIYADFLSER